MYCQHEEEMIEGINLKMQDIKVNTEKKATNLEGAITSNNVGAITTRKIIGHSLMCMRHVHVILYFSTI